MTPQGGTITTRPEISVPKFDKYMWFAGIDSRHRQREIFEDLDDMLVMFERFKDGSLPFQPSEVKEVLAMAPRVVEEDEVE